jgi:hypothetical protein
MKRRRAKIFPRQLYDCRALDAVVDCETERLVGEADIHAA